MPSKPRPVINANVAAATGSKPLGGTTMALVCFTFYLHTVSYNCELISRRPTQGPPDEGVTIGFPAGWHSLPPGLSALPWAHLLPHLLPPPGVVQDE